MADASTGVLKAVEADTLSNTTKSRTVQVSAPSKTMTVDKAVKREQPAQGGTTSTSTKLGQTGQSGSSASAAPRGSPPTQMKAPPGNAATASPKKVDSKGNSPQTKSSSADPPATASKSSLHPGQHQSHASAKSSPKKNPWNKNPSGNAQPPSGDGKKNQTEGSSSEPKASSGKSSHVGVSPTQKDPSKSIKIPKNEVQLLRYFIQFPTVHGFLYVQIICS